MGLLSDRRLAILRQYDVFERCQLLLTRYLRNSLFRRMFYVESEHVFARERAAERLGPLSVLTHHDEEAGTMRVTLRRQSSDFIVFRQVLMLRQYQCAVRLLRYCLPSRTAPTII